MRQDTDLSAERTDVAETAEGVGCDEFGARRHHGVQGVFRKGGAGRRKLVNKRALVEREGRCLQGNKLVGDDFDPDQATDLQKIRTTGHAEKESNRVADVSENQLDREVVFAVEVEVAAEPGQQPVDEADESDDTKESRHDHAGDFQTEPGAVCEGVQHVGALVFVIVWDNDRAGREGFLFFWVAEFADGQRGWDGHDAGGDEGLRVQAHSDIGYEHGAGDGSETAAHDLVQFGHGEMSDEGLDQHRGFTLSDEGRGGRDDRFGAGDAHGPEEEDGGFSDHPLDCAPVVEELHQGDEEDDGGKDGEEEPADLRHTFFCQESDTFVCESKQTTG